MSKAKEKKRLYIAAAAAAAVVAVIVLVTVLVLGGREETYRSIRIVELEGNVTIDRESVGSLEASVNMNLVSGDHVSTSAGAYVVLRLDEDKYVMLGEQGAMKVEADGDASKGRTAIHLEAGSVLSEIQKPLGQDSTYEIVTPNATMSVRGTVFEARLNGTDSDGNIEVLVYEGKVAVGFENQEPALYGGGEYTRFTANETPQFLVERSAIKEEQMNSQMLKRLQQIDESGRSLDFGEADLENLIGQKDSGSETLVADNSQGQEPAKNGNLPDPELQDSVTAAPSPDVTATEAPASTERPQSSAVPSPAVTKKPSEAPAPAVTPKPSEAPAPAVTPKPSEATAPAVTPKPSEAPAPAVTPKPPVPPAPAVTPKPSADPTQSPASTEEPKTSENPDNPDIGKKYTVEFYIPIIEEAEGNNIVRFHKRDDADDSREPRFKQESNNDNKIVEPTAPTFSDANASDNLVFAGWFTEQNEIWNFEDSVQENMKLYAVWYIKDHKDDNSYYYYPVILDDPETGYYRCRSVKVGSLLFDLSEDSVIYESNQNKDNGCPKRNGYNKIAWKIINNSSGYEDVYWNRQYTVKGVTSLVTEWQQP